jgi:hypothetical protein
VPAKYYCYQQAVSAARDLERDFRGDCNDGDVDEGEELMLRYVHGKGMACQDEKKCFHEELSDSDEERSEPETEDESSSVESLTKRKLTQEAVAVAIKRVKVGDA